ncbi:MAG: bifunctional (p)ppGpp synthetase/guanosine-3',5'-bis(diphosphate) 3'-pyrophosphohydrolase [Erysipelotrichaceae bacterium]|nr:bifunctional (p)ppGpp synthetase/guanosine-3',5'-bis(diphosphate) 3'-pyrophosphohydrolase [Erysipelotrichaceae bacterium]MBO4538059.1 bifunctional (p)ppGpp synthetase/guanosine-3',5'-bis(diphosphate) 3'-pyrophosphohydrolase [Erysipelotrichaceae bacterium]
MEKFDRAIVFATNAHKGQTRKGSNSPYIVHPLEVATIAATMTDDEDILCAAVLHDTVEDTDITLEQIEENFGTRVRQLVQSETENKYKQIDPSASWKRRKAESLQDLKEADGDMKMLWLSDKLSNMRSFFRMYLEEDDALWQHFHMTDPVQQYWYHHTILLYLADLDIHPAYQEYKRLLEIVFSTTIKKRGKEND